MVDGREAVSPADESIDDDLYRVHGAGAVATSPVEAVVEDEDGSRPGLGQCVTGDPVRGGLEHLQGVAELSGDDLQPVSAGDSPERGDAQQPRWPVQRAAVLGRRTRLGPAACPRRVFVGVGSG